ncbi:MAG: FKBP-type peptidyl-prolyl cis-trans isomerase [Bacteroidales bacterium]|nr:FKBP-type peptidyl-prolyl cis-trans isomerase [Bacteroidales bacterium]
MNKVYYFLFLLITSTMMTSCFDDDSEDYEPWRLENEAYFTEVTDSLDANGVKYYNQLPNLSFPSFKVLYHRIKSGSEDAKTPFYTSTVAVKYKGWTIDGTVFDESNYSTFLVNGVIPGWTTTLQKMKVGDKWRVVIPWPLAYGSNGSTSILPYSTLIFDIELLSIPKWETGTNPSDSE